MNGNPWVSSKTASAYFGVSVQTLRRWADDGRVEFQRTKGNHRVYKIGGESNSGQPEKNCYVYTRVSSAKQKDDLERQGEYMGSKYPTYKVIKDIGSGLNFKRKGLLRLLEESRQGRVQRVVVSSKDRLCRFGFDLLEHLFKQNNTELVVLDKTDKTPEEEFTEDILAVLQVFACRWNGRRSYSLKVKKNQIELDVTPEEGTGAVATQL